MDVRRIGCRRAGFGSVAIRSPPAGTGPFKVKDWKSGSRYLFERNDNYWRSDGPWVDEIEVVGIGDITARVNALLSGDINVMLELDPKAVSLIEKSDRVDLIRTQSGAFINLAMMVDREPTDNADFRLAMKHADVLRHAADAPRDCCPGRRRGRRRWRSSASWTCRSPRPSGGAIRTR